MIGCTMKALRLLSMIAVLSVALYVRPSHAVCFYPNSLLSGYHIPLKTEVKNSPAIIIGKVIHVQYVPPDPKDPDGVNSYLYTVKRLQELKGHVPLRVLLYATDDSGGYRMRLGETDLLFLTPLGTKFTADICGNSTELSKGENVVSEVRRLLANQVRNHDK